MMYLRDKFNLNYIESVQADVLELPYVNNDLSMFILLPSDISGLQKVKNPRTQIMWKSESVIIYVMHVWGKRPGCRHVSRKEGSDHAQGKANPKSDLILWAWSSWSSD